MQLPSIAIGGGRGFDSQDLDMFKAVLDKAVAELAVAGSALASIEQINLTRVRLAACIFLLAGRGERDPGRLKRRSKSLLLGSEPLPTLALRAAGAIRPH